MHTPMMSDWYAGFGWKGLHSGTSCLVCSKEESGMDALAVGLAHFISL